MLDPVSDMTKHITKNTGLVRTAPAAATSPSAVHWTPDRVIALLSSDDCYLSASTFLTQNTLLILSNTLADLGPGEAGGEV